jgi:hypothetical protein
VSLCIGKDSGYNHRCDFDHRSHQNVYNSFEHVTHELHLGNFFYFRNFLQNTFDFTGKDLSDLFADEVRRHSSSSSNTKTAAAAAGARALVRFFLSFFFLFYTTCFEWAIAIAVRGCSKVYIIPQRRRAE